MIHDLPVFQKSYDLYKEIYSAVKQFPKGDRYALGESCKSETLELIRAVVDAAGSKKEGKVPSLEKAIRSTELLKVHLRLGQDTGCLKEARYIGLQERLQEIGRMLGGWKRSI